MEAKELNIGDWVRTSRPFGSTDIDTFKVRYLAQNCGIENGEMQTFREYEEIFPVTITENILKANGAIFEVEDNYVICSFNGYDFNILNCYNQGNEDGFRFSVESDDDSVFKLCKYVHELQHALRLCGLSELADNFRV